MELREILTTWPEPLRAMPTSMFAQGVREGYAKPTQELPSAGADDHAYGVVFGSVLSHLVGECESLGLCAYDLADAAAEMAPSQAEEGERVVGAVTPPANLAVKIYALLASQAMTPGEVLSRAADIAWELLETETTALSVVLDDVEASDPALEDSEQFNEWFNAAYHYEALDNSESTEWSRQYTDIVRVGLLGRELGSDDMSLAPAASPSLRMR